MTVATAKARRPKGTGSIRHLGGERWQLLVKVDGSQVSRVFTARNATEANKAAGVIRAELIAEHDKRRDTDGVERERRRRWTVKQYAAFFLLKRGPHLSDNTRTSYRSGLTHHVEPYIGKLRMCDVTRRDLTELYERLRTKGARKRGAGRTLSGNTILHVHAAVRAMFTFAVDTMEDFDANPAAGRAVRPKVDMTPTVTRPTLTAKQVEQFVRLAADRAPRISVPVMLSASLGTRRGETVGLRWEDVDFTATAPTITVRRSVSDTGTYGVKVKGTKTTKQRIIPLDSHTLEELKRIQAAQRKERIRFGAGWRGAKSPAEDYIAAQPDGAMIPPHVFGNAFRTLCRAQGTPGATLHSLRHAWVSQMIALGFDAVTISAMSGHSPDVLLTVYAHAFDTRKREAMEALGEARNTARAAK